MKNLKNIKEIKNYDVVIISSYEYQSEIKEKVIKLVNKNKIFAIYDNSSRSLIDSYFIKNIKSKKKLFLEGSKTKIS